jgi:hypothetical protein
MSTWEGNNARRILVVKGAMIVCGLTALARSIWKTTAGRTPACSVPTTGFRSQRTTSPRTMVTTGFPRGPSDPHKFPGSRDSQRSLILTSSGSCLTNKKSMKSLTSWTSDSGNCRILVIVCSWTVIVHSFLVYRLMLAFRSASPTNALLGGSLSKWRLYPRFNHSLLRVQRSAGEARVLPSSD